MCDSRVFDLRRRELFALNVMIVSLLRSWIKFSSCSINISSLRDSSRAGDLLRKEYDFSKAQRGHYAGRSIKIVGSTPDEESVSARLALKIQQAIERDMKKQEVWKQLDQTQRDNLRTAWLKAIRTALNSR